MIRLLLSSAVLMAFALAAILAGFQAIDATPAMPLVDDVPKVQFCAPVMPNDKQPADIEAPDQDDIA